MNTYDLFFIVSTIGIVFSFFYLLYMLFNMQEINIIVVTFLGSLISFLINFFVCLADVTTVLYHQINEFMGWIFILSLILFVVHLFLFFNIFQDKSRIRDYNNE